MSDSDREEDLRPVKRVKRHKFLTFEQQIDKICIDVYLGKDPRRADPLPRFTSFFQERLEHWRELNAAEDFSAVARALPQLTHDMPQLVHNRRAIVGAILERLTPTAALSLEPLVDLLVWLARDLQQDCVPFYGDIVQALTRLVEGGMDRDPESLQHIFTALFGLTKNLAPWLSQDFHGTLQVLSGLRRHRAAHIRRLAAEPPALLLRTLCAGQGAGTAVRAVLADACTGDREAAVHAAACLLAAGCRHIGSRLHSRAPKILAQALRADRATGRGIKSDAEVPEDGDSGAAQTKKPVSTATKQLPAAKRLALARRHAAVLDEMVTQLLEHVNREGSAPLWTALLTEARHRLAECAKTGGSDTVVEILGKESTGETTLADTNAPSLAAATAAHALDHVSLAVETGNGGSVPDYVPIVALATAALKTLPLLATAIGQAAILRLCLALIRGHTKAAGASPGPAALPELARQWRRLPEHMDDQRLLEFWRNVLALTVGSQAAVAFGDCMTSHLSRILKLDVEDSDDPIASALIDRAWTVAADFSEAMVQQGCGAAKPLQAAVLGALDTFDSEHPTPTWAALQCIQALGAGGATGPPLEALAKLAGLVETLSADLELGSGENDRTADNPPNNNDGDVEKCTVLWAAFCAQAQLERDEVRLAGLASKALTLIETWPGRAAAMDAAAALLGRAAAEGLPTGCTPDGLHDLVDASVQLGSLRGADASLRRATLRVLCCFPQPTVGGAPSAALASVLEIERLGASAGGLSRSGSVALGRLATQMEERAFPGWYAAGIASSILGVLRIRYGPLWPSAGAALAVALSSYPADVWPVVLAELSATQAEFLSGVGRANRGAAEFAVPVSHAPLLSERFTAACAAEPPPGTDAAARLAHILKAIAAAKHSIVEGRAKDWVPLFVAYSEAPAAGRAVAEGEAGAEEADEPEDAEADDFEEEDSAHANEDVPGEKTAEALRLASSERPQGILSGKAWRSGLREWLALLAGLKGLRGHALGPILVHRIALHARDMDTSVQLAALKSLRTFKIQALVPYADRLSRLADPKTMRKEMASFSLNQEANVERDDDESIPLQPEHRMEVVPLLISVLFPKMRKRSGRVGRENARNAILNFLSGAAPAELAPVLALFLEPFESVFQSGLPQLNHPDGVMPVAVLPPWTWSLGRVGVAAWLQALEVESMAQQPMTRRLGLLVALEDLLTKLGHQLQMYLPDLLAITVVLVEGGMAELPETGGAGATTLADESRDVELVAGSRKLRNQGLRLITDMLTLFEGEVARLRPLWPRLFGGVVVELLPRLVNEAAAPRPPALIELAQALAGNPVLAPLLADAEGLGLIRQHIDSGDDDTPAMELCPIAEPWASEQRLGSRLLGQALASLAAPATSTASGTAVLDTVEALEKLPDGGRALLYDRHLDALLAGLKSLVESAWRLQTGRGGGDGVPSILRKHGRSGGTELAQDIARRALALLERVGRKAATPDLVQSLSSALLPLLRPGAATARLPHALEAMASSALAVLASIWAPLAGTGFAEAPVLKPLFTAMVPLAGKLLEGEPAVRLVAAVEAISCGANDDAWKQAAATLKELASLSMIEVGEPDHDRRLAAYLALTPEAWTSLASGDGGGPVALVLQRSAADLRNADDLALRTAASQALLGFVQAVKGMDSLAAAHVAAEDAAAAAAAAAATPMAGEAMDIVGQDDADEDENAAAAAMDDGNGMGASAPSADAQDRHRHTPTQSLLLLAARRDLFTLLRRGLTGTPQSVLSEHLVLMRALALALPTAFSGLAQLTNAGDEEADFWLNAAHIQLHRRARAAARLGQRLADPGFALGLGAGVLLDVLVPLLMSMALEGAASSAKSSTGGGASNPATAAREGDVSRLANAADAAAGALGSLGAALPWPAYAQVLGRALRALRTHAAGPASKPAVRVVCVLLDNFHFLGGEGDHSNVAGAEEMEAELPADDNNDPAATEQRSIHSTLLKSVIPELKKQLVSGDTVRAPVALALVKTLRLLPEDSCRTELPAVLQGVANLLRLKLQRARDDARGVLVAMAVELGPRYLPFVLDVLAVACPDKGMTAHVLGYTAAAVVEGLAGASPPPPPGSLDPCLSTLLDMVEHDLWGDVADAREAKSFAGQYREAKRCRASELYGLLARLCDFEASAATVLELVHAHLPDAANPKGKAILQQLVAALIRGFLHNASATSRPLCVFVYATLEGGLESEAAALEEVRREADADADHGQLAQLPRRQRVHEHVGTRKYVAAVPAPTAGHVLHSELLVEAALGVLAGALKKGRVPARATDSAPLLDPLLPLLARALESRHAASVSLALECLSVLLQADLPGMPAQIPAIGAALLRLVEGSPDASTPMVQHCFRLLGGLLRSGPAFQPGKAALQYLLGRAFGEVETSMAAAAPLSLLKALLSRKTELKELHSLMLTVRELMVKSQGQRVRESCAACLLQYLLDYPLQQKELDGHLQFLLTNLTYQHETGRLSALDMIATIIQKFPEQVIQTWAPTALLPLTTRLAADPTSSCRTKAAETLGALLRQAGDRVRESAVQFSLKWLAGPDPRLHRAALQLLGTVLEADAGAVAGAMPEVLSAIARILEGTADGTADGENSGALMQGAGMNGSDDFAAASPGAALSTSTEWRECYHAILLLEKALFRLPASLKPGPDAGDDNAVEACWAACAAALRHRHAWVQRAAGRVVLQAVADPALQPFVMPAGGPGDLGAAFLAQLEAEAADAELARQAVRGLVALAPLVLEADRAAGRVPTMRWLERGNKDDQGGEDGDADEAVDDDTANAATPAAGASGDSGTAADAAPSAFDGDDTSDDDEEDTPSMKGRRPMESMAPDSSSPGGAVPSLATLLRGVCMVAEDRAFARAEQRGVALRCIAAITSRLGAGDVVPFLPIFMRPLVRATERSAGAGDDDSAELAREVLEHIRAIAGAQPALLAHAAARAGITRRRARRRAIDARRAVVDPEDAAQRKMAKQSAKKAGRAKAMEEEKRLRRAGVFRKKKPGSGVFKRGGGGGARGGWR